MIIKPDNRVLTSEYSYTSAHEPKQMTPQKAAELYATLSPFLRIVAPYGNHLPPKVVKMKETRSDSFGDWPMAFRLKSKSITPPVCVTWNPKRKGKPPTLAQFLEAYNIKTSDYAH